MMLDIKGCLGILAVGGVLIASLAFSGWHLVAWLFG